MENEKKKEMKPIDAATLREQLCAELHLPKNTAGSTIVSAVSGLFSDNEGKQQQVEKLLSEIAKLRKEHDDLRKQVDELLVDRSKTYRAFDALKVRSAQLEDDATLDLRKELSRELVEEGLVLSRIELVESVDGLARENEAMASELTKIQSNLDDLKVLSAQLKDDAAAVNDFRQQLEEATTENSRLTAKLSTLKNYDEAAVNKLGAIRLVLMGDREVVEQFPEDSLVADVARLVEASQSVEKKPAAACAPFIGTVNISLHLDQGALKRALG